MLLSCFPKKTIAANPVEARRLLPLATDSIIFHSVARNTNLRFFLVQTHVHVSVHNFGINYVKIASDKKYINILLNKLKIKNYEQH